MPPGATILTDDPAYAVATWHNLAAAVWKKAMTVAGVMRLAEASRLLHARYPNGSVSASFSLHGLEMPSPDVRKLSVQLMKDESHLVKLTVSIVEGEGFMAAAMRSVVTSMMNLSKRHSFIRLVGTAEQAADLLVPYMQEVPGVGDTPRENVIAFLQAVRELAK